LPSFFRSRSFSALRRFLFPNPDPFFFFFFIFFNRFEFIEIFRSLELQKQRFFCFFRNNSSFELEKGEGNQGFFFGDFWCDMATKTRSEKQALKNLKVDPSSKLSDANLDSSKDWSPSEATSCISSGDLTGSVKESELDHEYLVSDQGLYYPPGSYYGYYYPGYEGSVGEVDDQGYVLSNDGLEIQYPAMQGDNGSLVYYMPGYQPGYVPYNPYIPTGTIGIDGQYMSQQSYMLGSMSPQSISPGYYPNPLSYGSETMQSYIWDPSFQVGDVSQGNGYGAFPAVGTKPSVPSRTITPKSTPSKSSKYPEMKVPSALDVSSGPGILNELKPANKAAAVLSKSYFPLTKYQCSNQTKGGLLYPNNSANFKANIRGWGPEKLKTRGKANGVGDFDMLNEQNRGPRTNSTKNNVVSGVDPAVSLVTEGTDNKNSSTTVIRRDEYNLPDFSTKYDRALFFVIKSYSEDDIHKSIKYNVWASTPNGNKRLDSAYQDAQEKMGQKGSKCPVFLFFSVNASGQFCGVAEMIGRVDFNKNMDFWQQDKWNGFFPVKWHIIKDVPNPHFRHIILENNDNKPVTNSRDTQEVKFPQGLEMLNVFKNYLFKTSILDDFAFYESRQKVMQDKRIRTQMPRLAQFQKVDEVAQVVIKPRSVDLEDTKNSELLIGDKAKE
ncbi:hypothetical protein AQUCO_03000273v1, partial [Aquilegia coerulea]